VLAKQPMFQHHAAAAAIIIVRIIGLDAIALHNR